MTGHINFNSLYIGIFLTFLVFIFRNRKSIIKYLNKILTTKQNSDLNKKLEEIMEKENVSYEKAKDILLRNEFINAITVSKKEWIIRNDLIIKQGDRISFRDKEVGLMQGDFIGLIKPMAVGYSDLYVIRTLDNSIRQAPVVFVDLDTINIYK